MSVVVPVYNMDDCLGECLDSLIVHHKGLLQKMEIIVVNDGSTDGTSTIAHRYADRYPGVFFVIDKENGNSGSCVNAALAVATGKYFRQLDADDRLDTVLLERFIRLLEEREEDLVSTPHKNCFPDGSYRLYGASGIEYGRTYLLDEVRISGGNVGVLSMHSLTYKLDFLKSYGHWQQEGIYYTDVEQCYFASAHARDIYFSDMCIYLYIFGREGQSVTFSMYQKNREHLLKVSQRLVKDYVARCATGSMSRNRMTIIANQALESLKPVYWIYLLAERNNPDFQELDRLVLSCPEMNTYAESACIFDGIPYVMMWHTSGLTPHFIFT